ncbi:helix-turn-helix transcriptional regulator [Proteocatella sphenisci]|uniref:helix-turn-helix transcriptional regulator n=1 Tax=Proteocatella sphenisci TaxID=181070 RepID=UPI0004BC7A97|nr:helix-turn-helix transcriptional regulator [Proteocatella sphenisci]
MKTMDMTWLFEGISKEELELDKLLSDISIAIIKERYALDMNQKDFARHLGISQPMVSKLESLEYNPSVKTLFQICKKLNLKLDISVTKVESATKSVLTRFVNKKESDVAPNSSNQDNQRAIAA